ncbi:sugar kinase [Streptomyces poriticola]|uniref:sugar kinase n=1 Tax=Streptomyces poriticola TaxID=3120506 RepID=UPI002FCE078B
MTTTFPHQTETPHPAGGRRVVRRRALTLLIIVLLIGIPAGYLVISAAQSRDSGRDKEEKYSATGMTAGWPSKLQRRLYQVPVPHPAEKVAYYETNNWKTSRLYVQFETSDVGLDAFLASLGVDRHDLRRGDIPISDRAQRVTGWEFAGTGSWWGVSDRQQNPAPTRDVVVDMTATDRPMVYVVSRTVP